MFFSESSSSSNQLAILLYKEFVSLYHMIFSNNFTWNTIVVHKATFFFLKEKTHVHQNAISSSLSSIAFNNATFMPKLEISFIYVHFILNKKIISPSTSALLLTATKLTLQNRSLSLCLTYFLLFFCKLEKEKFS